MPNKNGFFIFAPTAIRAHKSAFLGSAWNSTVKGKLNYLGNFIWLFSLWIVPGSREQPIGAFSISVIQISVPYVIRNPYRINVVEQSSEVSNRDIASRQDVEPA